MILSSFYDLGIIVCFSFIQDEASSHIYIITTFILSRNSSAVPSSDRSIFLIVISDAHIRISFARNYYRLGIGPQTIIKWSLTSFIIIHPRWSVVLLQRLRSWNSCASFLQYSFYDIIIILWFRNQSSNHSVTRTMISDAPSSPHVFVLWQPLLFHYSFIQDEASSHIYFTTSTISVHTPFLRQSFYDIFIILWFRNHLHSRWYVVRSSLFHYRGNNSPAVIESSP